MKIAATAVGMDAARTYREVEQRISGFGLMNGTDTPATANDFGIRLSRTLNSSSLTQSTSQSVVSRVSDGCPPPMQHDEGSASNAEKVLSQLTEQLIGQPVIIREVKEHLEPASPSKSPHISLNVALLLQRAEIISSIVYSQEEKVMFSAQGAVQTADGRDISFNLGLSMERKTMVTDSAAIGSNMFIDPLVLRFDTGTALLSDSVFSFDLNSDGQKEQLACPGRGCGFLSIDRDSDGVIGNGLELFGPTTGEGFGELAGFDSDANQWIDENDPIFDKLLIFSPDGQGGGSLQSLRQAGVGAISIVHAGTDFQMESQGGVILGRVKASGIFLTEAGEVRSLQEIDLATPATDAALASGAWSTINEQQELALQALRDIIGMQQFRLKIRLAEQRLENATQKVVQRQWLLDWLQNRSQWQTMTSGRNVENKGVKDPGSFSSLLSL
jgi:hypothetical protein